MCRLNKYLTNTRWPDTQAHNKPKQRNEHDYDVDGSFHVKGSEEIVQYISHPQLKDTRVIMLNGRVWV